MKELKPGWQERVNRQATEALAKLPASARPQRERPVYAPPKR